MTPFRGPSIDPGTAYEMGFMRALKRPVLGYRNDPRDYITRIFHHFNYKDIPFHTLESDITDPHDMRMENSIGPNSYIGTNNTKRSDDNRFMKICVFVLDF